MDLAKRDRTARPLRARASSSSKEIISSSEELSVYEEGCPRSPNITKR
jgi:hypothetical protein